MKAMKRLCTLFAVICLSVLIAVPAYAASNTTITAPSNSRTYEVYQIMTGDLGNGVLSNVKWGKNAASSYTEGDAVPESVLTTLAGLTDSEAQKLSTIETYVNLEGESMGTITNGASMTVPTGYYLIKDNGTVGEGEEYSLYIVQVVGPTTISPKTSETTSDKKVKDTNDSTDNSTTDWQDSADYDIGDAVPFKLSATITQKYANYSSYELVFHDEQSAGLTFNSNSVVVKVGDTTIDPSYYSIVTEDLNDGCTFEIRFSNLKNVSAVTAGSTITVEYNSTLNTNAVIGSTGNPNESHITYSNNPNDTTSKGETPDDKVKVFTYKVVVNKTDGTNSLPGAEFTLTKKLAGGSTKTIDVVKAESGTTFTFSGLDDGTYVLSETTTPAGYNTIADIEFTVSASHDTTADDPQLTELTGTATSGEITFTNDLSAGSLTTNVVNHAGSTLPTTGGIGTTIFYVVGGIMVAGAAILLITKKRMGKDVE